MKLKYEKGNIYTDRGDIIEGVTEIEYKTDPSIGIEEFIIRIVNIPNYNPVNPAKPPSRSGAVPIR